MRDINCLQCLRSIVMKLPNVSINLTTSFPGSLGTLVPRVPGNEVLNLTIGYLRHKLDQLVPQQIVSPPNIR